MTRAERLALLGRLARLRADRASGRLAKVQVLIDEMERRADAMRDVPDAPFDSMAESVMRDRWERWRGQNLARINLHVARLNTVAQPQREAQARETARAAILEKLQKRR
ncbi:hypothetical protein JDO7802_01105 [Jannaschia donghaensis]|uniref:Uncharacterized protein n=1 Tax=Jannaschia donghaensis TaxID=420998 RepID=A0A0M6YHC5_9RHOB|nr:hypothetical protein JDO7802_01105 [Jannaschia donghaensis]